MKALNREWKKQAATALFFVLLLLVGLLTADDYTGSYDELAEQGILESNLKEYAICLERLGVRWRYGLELSAAPISRALKRIMESAPITFSRYCFRSQTVRNGSALRFGMR